MYRQKNSIHVKTSRHTAFFGIDFFRIISALLVIAIHTSPLLSFSENADFFLTRILARIAVPFFFMVTGQFVISDILFRRKDFRSLYTYLKKIGLLYGIAILLYFPLGIYAGHYKGLTPAGVLQMLIFDGTFYHLWYFPALIIGALLICLFSRFLKIRGIVIASCILYVIGLMGDSYYGLIKDVPFISNIYEFGFDIFSYTRNGFFFAPVFLVLGALFCKKQPSGRISGSFLKFIISFLILTAEGFTLHFLQFQRHDSMYFTLIPVMAYLYEIILAFNKKSSKICRSTSTWIYIFHPAVIVFVRILAKVLHVDALFIDNSLLHYLAVAVISSAVAYFLVRLLFCFQSSPLSKQNTKKEITCKSGKHMEPPVPSPRGRAWIELDKEALAHNVAFLSSRLPNHCRLMPALKANAYGHGVFPVAKELNQLGIDAFCVASAAEGASLRENGITGEILVLGYTHTDDFPLLEHYSLTQTVIDYDYARCLNAYGRTLHVHIGIDTGMHRIGERSENIDQICDIFKMEHLAIDGLYTHLCASDTQRPKEQEYTNLQAEKFYQAVNELKSRGCHCPKLHLQSSYGVLYYPKLSEDYARIGIALYGVLSTKKDTERWSELWPVLSLKSRVASVKDLYAGESAGYGMQFSAEQDMKIAALSIGYADGLPRALSNGIGSVLINGRKAPIIGRICMDQTLVNVTGIPDVRTGDTAVLIGRSEKEEISVCDLAEQTGTITNEILSRMGARLERFFV